MEDNECKNNMGCIEILPNKTKNCTRYYSMKEASLFSWNRSKYESNRGANMSKEAVLEHGRVCESGVASRFS